LENKKTKIISFIKSITIVLFCLTIILLMCSCAMHISLFFIPDISLQPVTPDLIPRLSEQDIRATSPPEPTGLLLPSVKGQAVLGSPLGTFIEVYGQPIGTYGIIYIFSSKSKSVYDIDVYAKVINHASPTVVSTSSVESIMVNSSSTGWLTEEANSTCLKFAPSDAEFVKLLQVEDDNGHVFGVDMVYSSNYLAKTLPSKLFVDSNQNQTTSGSFDIQYLYANDSIHFNTCQLELGVQQTTPPIAN
jgi:hypothetical protein